jgi:8-oxo-dGTP pyrophosphatase MutT (NUDIX family)
MNRRIDPERIRRRLVELADQPIHDWHDRDDFERAELQEAAVLIPLFVRDDQWHAVFTKRSDDLETHSGEVSFPGGRAESIDVSPEATALREAGEEIALAPSDVEVFGQLAEMPTITGFHVAAYVGRFDAPDELAPQPEEIETIFEAPLATLSRPDVHRIESRNFAGRIYPVHFFEYGEHTIWGATGYLLYHLLRYLDLIDDRREES